jgi:hypothetical protein
MKLTTEPNITLLFPCKWSCPPKKMAGTETRRAAKLAFLSVDPTTNPNKLAGRPNTYLRKVPLPNWLQVLKNKLYFNNDSIEQKPLSRNSLKYTLHVRLALTVTPL